MTPSTASETLDEDTIQSAISNAIRTLQDQHRQEMDQLKREMQTKMDAMESQMQELGKQIVTQTYQALSTDDSPLATKTDHVRLQNDMNIISQQLSQLIQIVSQGSSLHTTPTSPPRTGKRLKKNRTPEKQNALEDILMDDKTVTSATSDLDEGSEGCEN